MTEKEVSKEPESTDENQGKEEVICPVCSNFEPQAWRKNMCRNCFHPLDEHGNDTTNVTVNDKKSTNDKLNDTKKSETTAAPEKSSKKKGEPPKTLPKTLPKLGPTSSKKESESPDSKQKVPLSPISKFSPGKLTPSKLGDDQATKGKLPSAVTSLASKKQTTSTSEKNVGSTDSKLEDKSPAQKKIATSGGPSALSKWKQNENKLISQKEKGPSGTESKKETTVEKQSRFGKDKMLDKNTTGDINTKSSSTADKNIGKKIDEEKAGKSTSVSKDNTSKLKPDDASKVKQFAKSFSSGTELDDGRFNSLERSKKISKDKLPTTSASATADNEHKSGIKPKSLTESAQKDTIGTATGAGKKDLSALNEKISKFGALTQNNKNVEKSGFSSLEKRKGSKDKNSIEESSAIPSPDGKRLNDELDKLSKKLLDMESKCKTLESENTVLRRGIKEKESSEGKLKLQKSDVENSIKNLQEQLGSMENRCLKLESDNTTLLGKVKHQQAEQQEAASKENATEEIKNMESDLTNSEDYVNEMREENDYLKQEIQDLKVEMDEMYDSFRDQEAEEFRDLQRELEMTAKNCRVLQFKLRKAERRNDQIEIDRQHYEEKLHILQNQFEDADAREHIRTIEDELRMAKEVSVRLHDELDILEDKRQKVEDENSHLTRLLEQSDKKQFRLEMEVDKLRDQLTDLRKQVAERSQPGTPSTDDITDRKTLLGRIGRQGSQEQEVSQLMKDLYDSMERETDLKDQLKFTEEEAKSMRKKLEEMEDENDNLSQQLKKMSLAQATKRDDLSGLLGGRPEVTEAEVELKVQLELNEQELILLKKKTQDMDNENEKLTEELIQLKKLLQQKDLQLQIMPAPSSPNAYYEDKLKEMNIDADELRWKIIEKDREIESLYAQVNSFQNKQSSKIKKSRSLDGDYVQVMDLRKQIDFLYQENNSLKAKLADMESTSMNPIRIESQVFESSTSRRSPSAGESVALFKHNIRDPDVAILNTKKSISKVSPGYTTSSAMNQNVGKNLGTSADVEMSEADSNIESSQNRASHDLSGDLRRRLQETEQENSNLKLKVAELEREKTQLEHNLESKSTEISSAACQRSENKDSDGLIKPGEGREELMDQVLDLEDEVELLTGKLKKKDEDITGLYQEVNGLRRQLDNIKDDFKKKELDLLHDLDLAQDKNDILSNLLDIIKERADNAEHELERFASSLNASVASDSASSARIVSTCSDVSTGSDEVFVSSSPGTSPAVPGSPETTQKRPVIQKDWDNQFRKRIDCLERLLAEERQKLAATEKKLALVSTESLSTAMSDDAKLHAREKELLEAEVLEGKKLLKIATDQIKGLRERVFSLEEENHRLMSTYNNGQTDSESDAEKTPSYCLDDRNESEKTFVMPPVDDRKQSDPSDKETYYKQKIEELEQQLQQVEDTWKSKCTTSEKEKANMDLKLKDLTAESKTLKESLKGFKEDVQRKQKQLRDIENKIVENSEILKRKDEIMNEQEEIIKQREEDMQSLLDQISQRDKEIRDLRETMRTRDDIMEDKDETIKSINETVESKQDEIHYLNDEVLEMNEKLKQKNKDIEELEGRLNGMGNITKSDWETENKQLKTDLDDMAGNLGKLHTDNSTLQEELEKAKQALSEAMVLWNKDRSSLEVAYHVATEKLRIYEATTDKKESQIVALLRKETHRLLEGKEKLATDFRVTKVENEANLRTLKNEKIKLQDELTQKIRQLTTEITSNDRMSQELERLRAQEDIAYQIQHHEKVLRAEYLAMKVRYETRLENLQKEHMKLLNILDKLQREKTLDKEIIKGVQKGMSHMKETYSQDLLRWDEERGTLEQHIKQIELSRKLAKDLQMKVEDLKQQLADQEYERAEIINKMTTERACWEVERSNMQSRINQLDEKLSMATFAQTKTKDMQTRMEVAWESERTEQKRLLTEAHSLALDLQHQLRERDDEHNREKHMLMQQLRKLRVDLDEEQIGRKSRTDKIESQERKITDLEKKMKVDHERAEKDHELSLKDRAELVRRMAEFRKIHKRDQRRIEDVLSELTKLRELAAIVVDADSDKEVEASDLASRLEMLNTQLAKNSNVLHSSEVMVGKSKEELKMSINEIVLKYMKESLKEIHFAAEDISRPRSRDISDDERKRLRRSVSSTELDFLLREDVPVIQQLESMQTDSLRNTPTPCRDSPSVKLFRNISCNAPGDLKEKDMQDTTILPEFHGGSLIDRQHQIMSDVHHEQGLTTKFPTPPPSFLLPRSHVSATPKSSAVVVTSHSTKTTITTQKMTTSSRLLPNSISLHTSMSNTSNLNPQASSSKSFSAGSSPVDASQACLSIPTSSSTSCDTIQSSGSGSVEKMTPRTARRKFFGNEESMNYQDRSKYHSDGSLPNRLQKISCSDPENIKTSASSNFSEDENIKSDSHLAPSNNLRHTVSLDESGMKSDVSSLDESISKHEPKCSKTAKEKRKAMKKSKSMDSSTVKDTLANAGVSALSAGAPSSLSASELFAAVKRKFKPSLRRSQSVSDDRRSARKSRREEAMSSSSKSSINGDGVCESPSNSNLCVAPPTGVNVTEKQVTPPTPPISMMNRKIIPVVESKEKESKLQESKKSRGFFDRVRNQNKRQQRSKSAERAPSGPLVLKQPIVIQEDLVGISKENPFSETSV